MTKVSVVSSSLKAVAYNPKHNTLTVDFKDGASFRYSKVPVNVHKGLMRAASHGAYFNRKVKDKFACRKVAG